MRYLSALVILMVLFTGCTDVRPLDEQAAMERGKHIAAETFNALSSRLQAQVASSGPAGAVEYCSLNALSLVDSIALANRAVVKRTSLSIRAPHDAPDGEELAQLQAYDKAWKAGEELLPVVGTRGVDSVAFYAPIMIIGPLCLKCHGGTDNGLDSSAFAAIQHRYPSDRAVGYSLGDLRGMWSIRWAR